MIGAVAIILTSHAVEIFAWALLYSFTQILPDVRSAIELSLGSYSTLGASGAALPARWQGLDGFEAMTGMLMFGWSTAVLAAVVQHTHTIED